jgi:hypothetical protein
MTPPLQESQPNHYHNVMSFLQDPPASTSLPQPSHPPNQELKSTLVNRVEWLRASNAYLYLRDTFPSLQFDPKGKCIDEIISCGEKRLEFARLFQHQNEFFSNLCRSYQTSILEVQTAMKNLYLNFYFMKQIFFVQQVEQIKDNLKRELEGNTSSGSQLARYGSLQSGIKYREQWNKKLNELTLDYSNYVAELEKRFTAEEEALQSFLSPENLIILLKATQQVELPTSPSLIVFFQGIPLDFKDLVELPKEAVAAELLELGSVHIEVEIVKTHDQRSKGPTTGSPSKQDKTKHVLSRFVIKVSFFTHSGLRFPLQTLYSESFFFPDSHWIQSAFKGKDNPQQKGKSEYEKSGKDREVIQAERQAFIFENFLQAKQKKAFKIHYPEEVTFTIFFEIERINFRKEFYKHLAISINSPTDLSTQELSKAVITLDTRQKMLEAFCSLAFPESFTKELTLIEALVSPHKKLWAKAEIMNHLKEASVLPDTVTIFDKFCAIQTATDEFEKYLEETVGKLKSEAAPAEKDMNVS